MPKTKIHFANASPAKPKTLCAIKAMQVTNKKNDVTCKKCIKRLIDNA